MIIFFEKILRVNGLLNRMVWGPPVIALILFCGVCFSCGTKFFQFRVRLIWQTTVGSLFRKKVRKKGEVSQFQAFATALGGTIGTGNIAGVATAIVSGGAGAVFWMWVSAFFGMMTGYAEKTLGIYYRKKNKNGEWSGGAMYYIEEGLKEKGYRKLARLLSVLYALFCVLASFGIGNMTQVNSMSTSVQYAFLPVLGIEIPRWTTGAATAVLAAVVILGGIKRIGRVCEALVPLMAGLYLVGTFYIMFDNAENMPQVFQMIWKNAFGIRAVSGGISGVLVKNAVLWGFKRGVFSNEAGLGSSVMAHSASNVVEPAEQGMWGIFEVFFDTIVICTLTALAVLSTGVIDFQTGLPDGMLNGVPLVSKAFSLSIGEYAGMFLSVSILFFAFASILGWSFYGAKASEYLFGEKSVRAYQYVFILVIVAGANVELEAAWDIADTFNGLMILPNTIGLLVLSGTVFRITKNYLSRRKNPNLPALISAYQKKQY